MESRESVILLEFNELTPRLMHRFIEEDRLPNFRRLYQESRVFVTDAEEGPGLLNPWVQWVTVHTGLTAAEHGIRKLGEAGRLKVPGLTRLLSDAGLRVLIWGSMNVSYDETVNGVVVPDPWTTGSEPHPRALVPFYRLVQRYIQGHVGGATRVRAGDYLRFLGFMMRHGLSASTVVAAVRQLARERTGGGRWRRVAVLDRLQWDVFAHYCRRVRPHFSTFFLNSTAHLQHKYWRNMEPDAFAVKPGPAEQRELKDAVRFGYEQMDRLVGRFMRLGDERTTLILCTALSQQPCLLYEEIGGKTFYKPVDVARLLEFVGVVDRCEFFPVMSEEFHLRFQTEASAAEAERRLSSLTVEGEAALRVTREGRQLFGGCRVFRSLPPATILRCATTGSASPFDELFLQAEGVKSGMHHPDGMLWIRRPDRRHVAVSGKVSLRVVAPTILQILGLPRPGWMSDSPVADEVRPPGAYAVR